jgi:nitrate/nitrite-specific signal transduction histidine kinase
LKISDDGKGFDMSSVASDSHGVGIMRERAKDIGASLSVQGRVSRGTEIVVVWDDPSREGRL